MNFVLSKIVLNDKPTQIVRYIFTLLIFFALAKPNFICAQTAAPTLSLTTLSQKAIRLNFPTSPAIGFAIMRKAEGGTYSTIGNTASGVTFHVDSVGLLPDTKYFYKVGIAADNLFSDEKTAVTFPKVPQIVYVNSACSGQSGKIKVKGTHTSGKFKWYDNLTGGTAYSADSAVFNTPNITSTTTFYVSSFGQLNESEPRIAITVNVFAAFSAQILGDTTQIFCGNDASLAAEPVLGAKYTWFLANAVVGNDSVAYKPNQNGKYRLKVSKDSCVYTSQWVNVRIKPKPIAEILNGQNVLFCEPNYLYAKKIDSATYEWLSETNTVIGTSDSLFVASDRKVKLRVNLDGCKSTSLLTSVSVRPAPSNPEPIGKPLILCEGNVLVLTTKKFFEAVYFWTSPTGIRYDGREVAIQHSDTLAPGAYILTTNLDGCLRHDTIQVKISPTIQFAANVKNPTCFQGDDGLIRIISISGTPLKAIFNGKEFVNTQFNFSNLKKGVYDVILKNSDSCSRKLTFTVLEPPQIHIFAGEDTITSPFQAVQLQATGDGKLYKWEPVEGLNDPLVANPIANPKQTTIYKVTGIDSLGCLATDEVLVTVIEEFTVPRILSPNGDKTNDFWQIENLAYFPNHEIKVWNRWGQEVFSTTNYQNDWDGTQGGNPLPEGAYYFLITAANGEKKVSGALNIAR